MEIRVLERRRSETPYETWLSEFKDSTFDDFLGRERRQRAFFFFSSLWGCQRERDENGEKRRYRQ